MNSLITFVLTVFLCSNTFATMPLCRADSDTLLKASKKYRMLFDINVTESFGGREAFVKFNAPREIGGRALKQVNVYARRDDHSFIYVVSINMIAHEHGYTAEYMIGKNLIQDSHIEFEYDDCETVLTYQLPNPGT